MACLWPGALSNGAHCKASTHVDEPRLQLRKRPRPKQEARRGLSTWSGKTNKYPSPFYRCRLKIQVTGFSAPRSKGNKNTDSAVTCHGFAAEYGWLSVAWWHACTLLLSLPQGSGQKGVRILPSLLVKRMMPHELSHFRRSVNLRTLSLVRIYSHVCKGRVGHTAQSST